MKTPLVLLLALGLVGLALTPVAAAQPDVPCKYVYVPVVDTWVSNCPIACAPGSACIECDIKTFECEIW